MIANGIFYLWVLLNALLFFYICVEIVLLFFALAARKQNKQSKLESFPKVTIQLPVYNEKYVIERLIDAVCKIDHPKELLEIHLLDDSTDETTALAFSKIKQYQELGIDIKHIQRVDREGFKAGALDYSMKISRGEFIAIFDADFIPGEDFLKKTLPYFNYEKVGVVQTRWSHINENFSFLTRAQAIMLNTHFSIEHLGRTSSGAFINFNGTAGIWRKSCVEDAGGWQADTLTEDLDLSFRAQMKGWKFNYLFDVESPAELPITVDAYKTQQYRWSKGAAECVRKNIINLWLSPVGLWQKIAGSVHLFNSSIFIIVFFLVMTSPMVFWMLKENQITSVNVDIISFLSLFITCAIAIIFFAGHLMVVKSKWKAALLFWPNFYAYLALSVGISFYMVIGVIEGYAGKVSEFVRTPKFNLKKTDSKKIRKEYSFKNELNIRFFELIILFYGFFTILLGAYYLDLLMINYGVIIAFGFTLKVFFPKYIFKI